jgi:hypothetical protein
MIESERIHKYRAQNGETPSYKALHEVYITKDLVPTKNEKLAEFIDKHIGEFKGHTEGRRSIPLMLFERKKDAQIFANELIAKLRIPKEHITIKASK